MLLRRARVVLHVALRFSLCFPVEIVLSFSRENYQRGAEHQRGEKHHRGARHQRSEKHQRGAEHQRGEKHQTRKDEQKCASMSKRTVEGNSERVTRQR